MLNKKTTSDYVNELSKEFGVSKKAVRAILAYGTKNMCRMIKQGEDVQLQHFGSIYFNKKAFGYYLNKVNERKSSTNRSDLRESKSKE